MYFVVMSFVIKIKLKEIIYIYKIKIMYNSEGYIIKFLIYCDVLNIGVSKLI